MKRKALRLSAAALGLALLFAACGGREGFIEYPEQESRTDEGIRIRDYTYAPVEDGSYPHNALSGVAQLKYEDGTL